MKKIAVLALAAAGLLVPAGTAHAKEIVSLKVCGASGCNTVTDRDQLRGWEQEGSSAPEEVASPDPQRFYTLELGFGDPEGNQIHRESAWWLPAGGLTRFDGDSAGAWWKASSHQTAMYEKVAAGLEAFTPELSKVTVKSKAVSDPSSYLRLLGPLPWAAFPKGRLKTVKIVLRASQPNPFVSGRVTMRYDHSRRLLIRPNGYVRVPSALGRLLMKRASLASSSDTSGSSGGSAGLYAGIGVGGLAALAVLAIARRKRMS